VAVGAMVGGNCMTDGPEVLELDRFDFLVMIGICTVEDVLMRGVELGEVMLGTVG
jgi:hypothetical protein